MVLAGFYEVNFLSVEFDLRVFLRFPPIFLTSLDSLCRANNGQTALTSSSSLTDIQ
jgi:hypothetical protein